MTDTTRDLIQRLVDIADTLDGRKPLVFSQGQVMDGFTALANFQALANEARAYLSQPEPEGPTEEELDDLFWKHSCEIGDIGVGLAYEDAPALIRELLARWGK